MTDLISIKDAAKRLERSGLLRRLQSHNKEKCHAI